MDEQLKVKVVVDKGDFKKDIKEVKKDLNDTAKTTKNEVTGVSERVKQAASSVKQAISTSIGISLGSLLSFKLAAKETTKGVAKDAIKTLKSIKKEMNDIFPDDSRLASFAAMMDPQVKEAEKKLKELKDSLDDNGKAIFDWVLRWEGMKNKLKIKIFDSKPIKAMSSAFGKFTNLIKNTAPFKALSNAFNVIKASNLGVWFKALGAAIKASIGVIAAAIGVLLALVVGITKVVNSVTQLGDSIDKGSQRMNMTTDQYQKWAYAMELCGSNIEELREGYNQMSGQISQAVNGTEDSANAFKKLGVNLYDTQGNLRQTGDIFEDVVTNLQSMDNATERTAAAYKLFGESTSKLNPLLNSNADFLRDVLRTQNALGSQMSSGLVAASAKYQDAITTMKQAWQGLKNTLGEAFLPVIQKVVVWVTVAVAKISALLRVLFGIKKDTSAKSMDKAANSVSAYTGAVNKATNAVKELKRQTMGFDEMNIMQSNDSGSSSSGSDNSDMGISAGVSDASIGSLLPEDALKDIENFQNTMDRIGGKVAGWVTALAILGGAVLFIVGALSLNIPMVLGGAALCGIGIAIGDASGTFAAWDEWLSGIWDSISSWFSNTISAIGDFFSNVWNDIKEGAKSAVDGIVGFFSNIGEWFYTNVIEPVSNFFSDLWKSIKDTAKSVADWFVEAWTDIKDFFANIWSKIKEGAVNTWDKIKNVFSVVGNWFNEKVISPVANFFSGMWDKLKNGAKNAWDGIKNVFSTVAQFFGDIFSKAWQKVKDIFSTGGKIFDGIKDGIVNAFKAIVNAIITGINKVVAIPFNGINWALNKIRSIDILGLKPFSWVDTIDVPQIPKLAKGGIATSDTLAHIGENGYKEAVLPLDRNTQWMDAVADRVIARMPTQKVVLQVGERELGWATIGAINGITQDTGKLQLSWA